MSTIEWLCRICRKRYNGPSGRPCPHCGRHI